MPHCPWFAAPALALVGLLAFVASSARATVLVEVPIEEMARDADAIVIARVLRSESQLVIDPVRGADPHTITTLAVERWLVGSGGATVEIDELGGTIHGTTLAIAGTPAYAPGEEVIVFLERFEGRLRTYGMAQGRFEIRRGVGGVPDAVFRNLEEVAFARWERGTMVLDHAAAHPAAAQAADARVADAQAASLEIFVAYIQQIAVGFRADTRRGGML